VVAFLIGIHNNILWEFFDCFTVFFEIGFLFSVFNPTIFRTFIFVAVIFHLFKLLILEIQFVENQIAFLLFTNWGHFGKYFKRINFNFLADKIISHKILFVFIIIQLLIYFNLQQRSTFEDPSIFYFICNKINIPSDLILLISGTVLAYLNLIFFFNRLINKISKA